MKNLILDLMDQPQLGQLDLSSFDPVSEIQNWIEIGLQEGEKEPSAFCLSTWNKEFSGPDSRMVLFKRRTAKGFVFFSSLGSDKGKQIQDSSQVSAVFFFPNSYRQIRVLGVAQVAPGEIADEYFATRPRESRLAARTSLQSRRVASRAKMEEAYQRTVNEFTGREEIPRPEDWVGFEIIPQQIEFWRGREGRFHDRLQFQRGQAPQTKEPSWSVHRLWP